MKNDKSYLAYSQTTLLGPIYNIKCRFFRLRWWTAWSYNLICTDIDMPGFMINSQFIVPLNDTDVLNATFFLKKIHTKNTKHILYCHNLSIYEYM